LGIDLALILIIEVDDEIALGPDNLLELSAQSVAMFIWTAVMFDKCDVG
jgi:hypothetical protein